jgi:hypothetical protein
MPVENKDPSGEITLVDYENEYSGGNKEDIRSVKLVPAAVGKSVCLVEHNSHFDFWPNGKSSKTEAEWEISVDELISFIKANGKRTKQ